MKIAWFSDLSTNTVSYNFTIRVFDYLRTQHEIQLFSLNSNLELNNGKVKNYLTYESNNFDIAIFIIEDLFSSKFVYDFSIINPGIRILVNKNFNNLKFASLQHNSNGIVYDRLLQAESYDDAIEIGKYHMRGWSMKPYHHIYPLSYPKLNHGLSLTLASEFINDDSNNIFFPITVNSNCSSTPKLIKLQNDSINYEAIKAVEDLNCVIFLSRRNHFGQISIAPGIFQDEMISRLMTVLNKNKILQDEAREAIVKYAENNTVENVCYKLESIIKANFLEIKSQIKALGENNLLSYNTHLSKVLLENFSVRFSISE